MVVGALFSRLVAVACVMAFYPSLQRILDSALLDHVGVLDGRRDMSGISACQSCSHEKARWSGLDPSVPGVGWDGRLTAIRLATQSEAVHIFSFFSWMNRDVHHVLENRDWRASWDRCGTQAAGCDVNPSRLASEMWTPGQSFHRGQRGGPLSRCWSAMVAEHCCRISYVWPNRPNYAGRHTLCAGNHRLAEPVKHNLAILLRELAGSSTDVPPGLSSTSLYSLPRASASCLTQDVVKRVAHARLPQYSSTAG